MKNRSTIVVVITVIIFVAVFVWIFYLRPEPYAQANQSMAAEDIAGALAVTASNDVGAESDSLKDHTIQGFQVITDAEFKTQMIEYLHAEEEKDQVKIYNYLSKRYLNEHYPDVTSGEEFQEARAKFMW